MSKQDKECTLFPDGEWTPCCVVHDIRYKKGGTLKDKKKADIELLNCFLKNGYSTLGLIIYVGVRLGGKLPFGLHFGKNFKE